MEIVVSAVIGLFVSVLTEAVKKLAGKIGAQATLCIVFAATLICAGIYTLIRQYAPPELITTFVTAFGLAIAWYEVLLKRMKIW